MDNSNIKNLDLQRSIERLNFDKEGLQDEIDDLSKDITKINITIISKSSYIKKTTEEIRGLRKSYMTILNLFKKIPGLEPAIDPVEEKITVLKTVLEREKRRKNELEELHREKLTLINDMRKDLEAIENTIEHLNEQKNRSSKMAV